MTYEQCENLISFLNERLSPPRMKTSWYLWAVRHSWNRCRKWAKRLGYKEETTEQKRLEALEK